MKIYVRKLYPHDISHEVSVTRDFVNNFFQYTEPMKFVGRNSGVEGYVTINSATDPRFGGAFKAILDAEGIPSANDVVLIEKANGYYKVDLIKQQDSRHNVYVNLFNSNERHTLIEVDLPNLENTTASDLCDSVGYNKIFYGIPGCGKSYYVEHTILQDVKQENIFRTTFYLDYSYSDFIGQIYPTVNGDVVTYTAKPGPFTMALEKALLNKNEMVYLVIEEINRGNAAAIFGDTFQLLDRLDKSYKGRVEGDSEYPISNSFIEDYFTKQNEIKVLEGENLIPFEKGNIYIPRNLTILATMNTSDQNVFPLDTAFKRRFDRERVIADWENGAAKEMGKMCIPFTNFTWKQFVEIVNKTMAESDRNEGFAEDKKIGPYYISKNLLVNENERFDLSNIGLFKRFVNNVIDYLYQDAVKYNQEVLFKVSNNYDKVYDTLMEYVKESPDYEKANRVFSDLFVDEIVGDVPNE